MKPKPLAVYDWKTGKRLAFLDNAYDVKYKQTINSLWTGSFKLPYSDEKKKYCEPFNLVEIWDVEQIIPISASAVTTIPGGIAAGRLMGGLLSPLTYSGLVTMEDAISTYMSRIDVQKYVGLFRILPSIESESESGVHEIEYTLEHVLGTLLDSYIIDYQLLGGEGNEDTEEVISKILSGQDTPRWILNECDYHEEFLYEFENMNLLNSLYYVVGALSDNYYWSFNTKNTPWELNLKTISETPVTDIRYKKNIFGIKKKTDPTSICTRLYVYGRDGLSISSINDGLPYLDSEEGIANYGIIVSVITDNRFEIKQSLKEYGLALINKLSEPFVTYEIDIRTLYNASLINIGDIVRVVTEDGLDRNLVVQEISKDDLTGTPNSGTILVGEGTVDLGLIMKSVI
jgi:phage minor structural protein